MTFSESINTVLVKKYATFSGRAARSEFWWFFLASILVSIFFGLIGWLTGLVQAFETIDNLVSLAILVPTLAVTCRRLHDTERSGWWQVLPVVPIFVTVFILESGSDTLALVMAAIALVSIIVLIVWLATRGTPGPNRFGNDPLSPDTDAEIFA